MKITIDTKELESLVKESDGILFSPEAEKTLIKLLDIQDSVETAIKEAKEKIGETALKLDPNFTSVLGKDIKVGYRYFGAKFDTVPGLEDSISRNMVDKVIKYNLNSKKVEEHEQDTGKLPDGVMIRDRKKTITFSRRDKYEKKS